MNQIDRFLLAIRRAETPATRILRDTYKELVSLSVPVNGVTAPMFSALYRAWLVGDEAWEITRAKLLWEPMARSRFDSVGENLRLGRLPIVRGHVGISIGDHVYMGARIRVESGRFLDAPVLKIGSHVTIASDCRFSVSKRVELHDHVSLGASCEVSDGDGHHSDVERRKNNEPLTDEDLKPVVLEEGVWLGRGVRVLKGVTIGTGAIVAAGSVVTGNIPAGALAMGVPARVVPRK